MNNSTNVRSYIEQDLDHQEVGFGVLYGLTILFGLIGNVFVMLAVLGDKAMRKTTINRLILSLAIVPDVSFQLFFGGEWVTSGWMCTTTRSLQFISLASSAFSQVCIAIERYWAIVYPMFAKRIWQSQASVFALFFIWFFSIIFNLPTILNTRLKSFRNETIHRCVLDWAPDNTLIYRGVGCIILYFIPLVIILFVYSRSFRQLNKAMALWMPKGGDNHNDIRCSGVHGAINKGRKRTLLMLAMCAILYLVCYSPIQLMLISQFVPYQSFLHRWISVLTGSKTFKLLVHALVLVNSAGNPALYTLFSNRYRNRFQQILQCKISNRSMAHRSMDYNTATANITFKYHRNSSKSTKTLMDTRSGSHTISFGGHVNLNTPCEDNERVIITRRAKCSNDPLLLTDDPNYTLCL